MDVKGMRSWNFNVASLEKAAAFYKEALGAEERTRHQVAGVDVVRLQLGDTSIGLFDASGGPAPGVPHHTLEIEGPDDPEQLRRELEEKGMIVESIRPHRESGYSVYVSDPEGNRLELSVGSG